MNLGQIGEVFVYLSTAYFFLGSIYTLMINRSWKRRILIKIRGNYIDTSKSELIVEIPWLIFCVFGCILALLG